MSEANESLRQIQQFNRSLKVSNISAQFVRHFQRREIVFKQRRDALVSLTFPTL